MWDFKAERMSQFNWFGKVLICLVEVNCRREKHCIWINKVFLLQIVSEFILLNVQPEDGGVFHCSASNPAGAATANLTLEVIGGDFAANDSSSSSILTKGDDDEGANSDRLAKGERDEKNDDDDDIMNKVRLFISIFLKTTCRIYSMSLDKFQLYKVSLSKALTLSNYMYIKSFWATLIHPTSFFSCTIINGNKLCRSFCDFTLQKLSPFWSMSDLVFQATQGSVSSSKTLFKINFCNFVPCKGTVLKNAKTKLKCWEKGWGNQLLSEGCELNTAVWLGKKKPWEARWERETEGERRREKEEQRSRL